MVTGEIDLFAYQEVIYKSAAFPRLLALTDNLVQAILPDVELNAKNSTSLHRQPAAYSEFVRGRTTHFPFAPGKSH